MKFASEGLVYKKYAFMHVIQYVLFNLREQLFTKLNNYPQDPQVKTYYYPECFCNHYQ